MWRFLFCAIYPSVIIFLFFFFFFNDTATTEIYTLSLHDALPISNTWAPPLALPPLNVLLPGSRSEEHTSELQSLAYLVCRLLLEKKKKTIINFSLLKKKKKLTCKKLTNKHL